MLHDVDIEASACVHSFHYPMLCYANVCCCGVCKWTLNVLESRLDDDDDDDDGLFLEWWIHPAWLHAPVHARHLVEMYSVMF